MKYILIPLLLLTGCGVSPHKIQDINTYVNSSIDYVEDINNQGVTDYWQTPEETLRSKRGDCEDFALLKASMLSEYGYRYLILVADTKLNAYHAILKVDRFYLDNRRNEIYTRLPERYRMVGKINTEHVTYGRKNLK